MLAQGQCLSREHWQHLRLLCADDHVDDAGRPLDQLLAFLLRHAAGDGDDRIASQLAAHLFELAEPRVELLLRALAHAARVDHYQVGIDIRFGAVVTRLLQQAGHALGIVDVHLATVGFDEVLHDFRFRLSLSPPAFACRESGYSLDAPFAFVRAASSSSRAPAIAFSPAAVPPIMRAISATRSSPANWVTLVRVRRP